AKGRQVSSNNPNVPRYIAPDFLQYLCERENKRMKRIIYSTFAVFILACFALAQQAPDSVSVRVITTFDYPGTGNSTFPQKINDTTTLLAGTSTRARWRRAALSGSATVPLARRSLTLTTTVFCITPWRAASITRA